MATVTEKQEREALDQIKGHDVVNTLREKALDACKTFKVSWVELGQILHAIKEDKLFHAWGYEKFENYTTEELGFDKKTALKLLKNYDYVINENSEYLKEDFAVSRGTESVPSLDEINFLRLARGKKELLPEDQTYLKQQVFDKGRVGEDLKRDLCSLMRERKITDPEEEKEKRRSNLIKNLVNSLSTFHAEMRASKLVSYELIEEAEALLKKLKEEEMNG